MSIDIDNYEFSKPTGHTTRYRYYHNTPCDYVVECRRPKHRDMVPITEADDILPINMMMNPQKYNEISLRKNNLFNDFIEALETSCISKKSTVDKKFDTESTEYTLPVTDYLYYDDYTQPEIYQPVECPKKDRHTPVTHKVRRLPKRSYKYYEAMKAREQQKKFIKINGNLYDSQLTYARVAGSLVPLIQHPPISLDCTETERYVNSSVSINQNISLRFHSDVEVDGIILKPEPMKFENIYADAKSTKISRKSQFQREFIRCLINDPGYVTQFELYFRSSQTNGEWIKYGIFSGNPNNHTDVKIYFDDTITAKELRIVPLSHYAKYDKIKATPFVKYSPSTEIEKDETCTYILSRTCTPRDNYGRAIDGEGSFKFERRYYEKLSRPMKNGRREFNERCADAYD